MKLKKMQYWKRNLRVEIAVSFTMIAVIGMVTIAIILYYTYTRSIQQRTVDDNIQLVNQVELNLTSYLRNMMRISDASYYNIIKDTDFSKESIDRELTLLYEANKDNVVSIACFENRGSLVAATPVNTIKEHADVTEQEWFQKAKNKPENLHFSSSHVQNLFVDSNDRYYWVVSLSRGVELTRRGSTFPGVLLVDMDFSGIEHLFTKVNSGDMSYMYLMNQDGEIIYHPQQNLVYSGLVNENNAEVAKYEDGTHTEEFHGKEQIVVVKTVGYTGWKIVSVIPMEKIRRDRSRVNAVWVTVVALAITMLIAVNQYLSLKITGPISHLEDSVKQLDIECPEKIYVGGSDEIQHLGKTIRSMVEQMRKLMDAAVKEQEEKRKNELDALQSQINPHFLYNSLDSIIWLVESGRYEEAVSAVTALANLFRISLSQGRTLITIGEEFQHAKNYSSIQQMRFKDKFRVEFELDEGLEKYITIKLVIQPILENAMYYGMEVMDGDGKIKVKGYEKDGDIYIDIIDNGIGMAPEQVDNLLTGKNYVRKRGSGIGLKNVNQRIKLYFGDEYGLLISSEPDVGTKVSIHLPMKLEVDEND